MNKVYTLNLNKVNIDYLSLLAKLPTYCKEKISSGKDESLKRVRTYAWFLLYKILIDEYNIDLTKCDIYENEYGKPYINDLFFNISHSKDWIGIIISSEECGIDIEKIELKIDKDKFASRILSDKENVESVTIDYLIRKWTILETYYKIIGRGISLSKLKDGINTDK